MMKVASIAVVHPRDGSILYIHRKDNKKWTLPGGSFEEGENPLEAAKRELWEETGIKATSLTKLGVGIVTGKHGDYEVHAFKYEPKKKPEISFKNDPDEEADSECWFGGDSDSDYASGLPTVNVHVPNDKNVTLILLGEFEASDKVKITEGEIRGGGKLKEPIQKAIKDIPLGTPTIDDAGHEVYDYNHLLPTKWSGKLHLQIKHKQDDPDYPNSIEATLHNPEYPEEGPVGFVKAGIFKGKDGQMEMEPHSELHEDYHGEGLGRAMYEALYGHAKNALGVSRVAGFKHTQAAKHVHDSLARLHGLEYHPKKRLGDPEFQYGSYSYKI